MPSDGNSIYKIAELAGVSVATVSRVVNGKPGVGDKTRKRVLQLLREHDFQPRMSRSTTNTMGVFSSFRRRNPFSDPYTHRVLEGISDIVFSYGYDMMMVPLDRVPKTLDEFRIFCQTRGIAAGVFFLLHQSEYYVLDYEDVIPLAVIGTAFRNAKHVTAKSNTEEGAALAVNHLIELGHRRIAFFHLETGYEDHHERLLGYRKALEAAEIGYDPSLVIECSDRYDLDFRTSLERVVAAGDDRATAVFAVDDQGALNALSAMQSLGLSVPDDVSLVGFDDNDYAMRLSPPLTTVRQSVQELARRASRAVIDLADGRSEAAPEHILLPTKLIIRGSTAPPSAST